MKLLADENIDKLVVDHLRIGGHNVTYVLELAPGIADDEVLDISNLEERVLLTSDKDFGELVFRRKMITTGVLLLRLAGLSSKQKACNNRRSITRPS